MTKMQAPVSKILNGLKFLRRDNPWPEFPYGDYAPFNLPLDGGGRGGREILIDLIQQRDVKLMVEVGCFLCGSTLQWLNASKDLTIIGVDPWEGNWAAYIETMAVHPSQSRSVWHLSEEEIARVVTMLRQHGNFANAMNNVRLYKDRFIPVRRKAPDCFAYLKERQIEPDLIYIDAFKTREDLDAAYAQYPDAIIAGDDWLWPDENGVMVMQEHVKAFAKDHGFEVEDKRQTWIVHKPARKRVRVRP